MARNRQKTTGRGGVRPFIQMFRYILEHPNYAELSCRAVKLLYDLYGQYNGRNNGDFCAAWSIMNIRGWKSKDQLQKAKVELLKKGWIVITRQGGRRIATLYAVTFLDIDECGGKLDRPQVKALHYWKNGSNPEY